MEVRTTRFGVIEISEDRVITFPKGLLGFPEHHRYCLLQPGDDACFFWLQSLDDPELAFVVTDPTLFMQDYSVPIRAEQLSSLGLSSLDGRGVRDRLRSDKQMCSGASKLDGPAPPERPSTAGGMDSTGAGTDARRRSQIARPRS